MARTVPVGWFEMGAVLSLGCGAIQVSLAESGLPEALGPRGGTVPAGSQEVAPEAGLSLPTVGGADEWAMGGAQAARGGLGGTLLE